MKINTIIKSVLPYRGAKSPEFEFDGVHLKWTCLDCHWENENRYAPNSSVASCSKCSKEHRFIDGLPAQKRRLLIFPPARLIYVTKATSEELSALIAVKRFFFSLRTRRIRQVRKRFVYHSRWECSLAHRNLEEKGVTVVYNSGVVKHAFQRHLKECQGCGLDHSNVCPRCSGRGIFPFWRHIQEGRCFKCNGKGVVSSDIFEDSLEVEAESSFMRGLESVARVIGLFRNKDKDSARGSSVAT